MDENVLALLNWYSYCVYMSEQRYSYIAFVVKVLMSTGFLGTCRASNKGNQMAKPLDLKIRICDKHLNIKLPLIFFPHQPSIQFDINKLYFMQYGWKTWPLRQCININATGD